MRNRDEDNSWVTQRVNERMRGIRWLMIHAAVSLALVMLAMLGGAAEVLTALPAAVITLVAMFSLVIHGALTGMGMMRQRIYDEELERDHLQGKNKGFYTFAEDAELTDVDPFLESDDPESRQSRG